MNFLEIPAGILKKYGLGVLVLTVLFIITLSLGYFYIAYQYASPKTTIKVMFGLIELVKKEPDVPPINELKCPFLIDIDEAVMRCMIDAESEAVNGKSIDLIGKIFSPDAQITDFSAGKRWSDAIEHYTDKFQKYTFNEANNYSIQKIYINLNEAKFISASKGKYIDVETKASFEYNNGQGSNEWIFIKISEGCWIISSFTYNIRY
jgi:hypothetical protein